MNDKTISSGTPEAKGNFGWAAVCSLLSFVLLSSLLFSVQHSTLHSSFSSPLSLSDASADLATTQQDAAQLTHADLAIASGIQHPGLYDSSRFIDKSYEGVEVETEDDDETTHLGFCTLPQAKLPRFLEEISPDLDYILVCRKLFVLYHSWKSFLLL